MLLPGHEQRRLWGNRPEDDSHRRDQQAALSATLGDLMGTHTHVHLSSIQMLTGMCRNIHQMTTIQLHHSNAINTHNMLLTCIQYSLRHVGIYSKSKSRLPNGVKIKALGTQDHSNTISPKNVSNEDPV